MSLPEVITHSSAAKFLSDIPLAGDPKKGLRISVSVDHKTMRARMKIYKHGALEVDTGDFRQGVAEYLRLK